MKGLNLLFCLSILLIFTGCVTSDSSAADSPSWITTIPEDSGAYYIGISGSRTGIESDDRDLAYDKALKDLAGAIYSEVRGSSTLSEREDAEGYRSTYENNIETGVASNLADIETVETYYSDEMGYWIYLRLSKAKWAMIVEQRSREMQELAEDLFYDVFPDSLTELKVVGRAMDEFYRLYSGKPIKMELLGQKGSVDSILILRAEKLLGEMAITWEPLGEEIVGGKPVPLKGRVITVDNGKGVNYENPGAVTLILSDGKGREIRRFQTERDGSFDLDFTDRDNRGATDYLLSMESPYGEAPLTDLVGYRLPAARQTSTVKAYVLPVAVESDWNSGELSPRTLAFLKELNVTEVAPRSESDKGDYLRANVSFRKAPANDYGMIFCYASLHLTIIKEGEEMTLWRSKEYKDGGLTEDQAFQRASEKLFDGLLEEGELTAVLEELN
ncbi:MAG: hypothetical protein PQJ59_01040 [Spirochaetales bacterium]|nr:hypothetical protein [Spirochaetales bacterium]